MIIVFITPNDPMNSATAEVSQAIPLASWISETLLTCSSVVNAVTPAPRASISLRTRSSVLGSTGRSTITLKPVTWLGRSISPLELGQGDRAGAFLEDGGAPVDPHDPERLVEQLQLVADRLAQVLRQDRAEHHRLGIVPPSGPGPR